MLTLNPKNNRQLANRVYSRFWLKLLIWLGLPSLIIFSGNGILAQIIPDQTLGDESSVVIPVDALLERIEGGAKRGENLFHSFQEFSIQEGNAAYFANPTGINNIFSRVTGNNVSNILGKLGVDGFANLFFLNPNGIIFGANSSLDIKGSFVASTANSFVFNDGSEFSATNPNAPPLLTVNITPGLQLNNSNLPVAGAIDSQGNLVVGKDLTLQANNLNLSGQLLAGENLTLQANDTVTIRDSITQPFIAASGKDLLVQGNNLVDIFALNHPDSGLFSYGDMVLRSSNTVGGDAHYWSGGSFKIEKLDGSLGDLYSPYDPIIRSYGDVSFDIYVGTSLHIIAGGSVNFGTAYIYAPETGVQNDDFIQETVTLSDGSTIDIDGSARPTLDIRAGVSTDKIGTPGITGFAGYDIDYFTDANYSFLVSPPSTTQSATSADINIGDIVIDSPNGLVFITNQYEPNLDLPGGEITINGDGVFGYEGIYTRIADLGDSGDVIIDSRGDIILNNASTINTTNAYNNAGDVTLLSDNDIIFNDNSLIITYSNYSNSGNVIINSHGDITLNSNSKILTYNYYGNAGNVSLLSDQDIIMNGSRIWSDSWFSGNSGNIIIKADGDVSLTNSTISNNVRLFNTTGVSGNILINANSFVMSDNSTVSSNSYGISASNIDIKTTGIVKLEQGSEIQISAYNSAIGGNISIDSQKLILEDGGNILNNNSGEKDGGDVILNASDSVQITGTSSQLGTNAYGKGKAGNIEITTPGLLIQDGGSLATSTSIYAEGKGGNITINATDSVQIIGTSSLLNTDTFGKIQAGDIDITTQELLIKNGGSFGSLSYGEGSAGNILISSPSNLTIDGNIVSSAIDFSTIYPSLPPYSYFANGGDVTIVAEGNINFNTGSNIFSQGLLGGNITLDSKGNIELKESYLGSFSSTNQSDLQGGKIEISGNSISIANGSHISSGTIGTATSGLIKITADDTVSLTGLNSNGNSSLIENDTYTEGNSGGIEIKTGSLLIDDGARISSSTSGKGDAGLIKITANDTISLSGEYEVDGKILSSYILSAAQSTSEGDSLGIEINTSSLSLNDGAYISSSTSGKGDGGLITIVANNINLAEESQISSYSFGQGNAGDIDISTVSLFLKDGSTIGASSIGEGDTGLIKIDATDTIHLSGENSFGTGSAITSDVFSIIPVNVKGVEINTNSLFLYDGSQITSFTAGLGDAGLIDINAKDTILISGKSSTGVRSAIASEVTTEGQGNSQGITINTNSLILDNEAGISASTEGQGNAGNIDIIANNLQVANGSQIVTETKTDYQAGDIILDVADYITLKGTNSGLFAQTSSGGNAGNITINTPKLSILDNAQISAFTSGNGDAGNIQITAPQFVTLDNNSKLSVETSGAGQAGDIIINSDTINIGKDSQLSATVTETSTNLEGGGSITLNASNLNISGKLGIFAETQSIAPAGNLTLKPFNNQSNLNIIFTDNGFISASTSASGKGGDISISAPESIDISGLGKISVESTGTGDAGDINFSTNNLTITDGVTVSASTSNSGEGGSLIFNTTGSFFLSNSKLFSETLGSGNAGNIIITTPLFIGENQSQISASTSGSGNAGVVEITTSEYLEFTNSTASSEVTATGQGEAGTVIFNSPNINLTNSNLSSSTSGQGNAKDVEITANNSLTLNNTTVSSSVQENAVGNAGTVTLTSPNIDVTNNSNILTSTAGQGSAGVVRLATDNSINFTDSKASSEVTETGKGEAGTVIFNSPDINLTNSTLSSSTSGQGDAKDITITANNSLNLNNTTVSSSVEQNAVGNAGTVTLISPNINVSNNSNILTSTSGQGSAGTITVDADNYINFSDSTASSEVTATGIGEAGTVIFNSPDINLTNSTLSSSTSGQGNAKDVEITANNSLNLNNTTVSSSVEQNAVGNAGSVTLNSPNINITNNSQVSTSTAGNGNAGNVIIPNANIVSITGNSSLSSATTGVGQGGTIKINLNTLTLDNSRIFADTTGTGNAGTININTGKLSLTNNSEISSSTTNAGKGGDINITANEFVELLNSRLLATTAGSGNAGNITVKITDYLLIDGDNAGIFANTTEGSTGNGGNIWIDPKEVTVRNGGTIGVNSQGSGIGGNIFLQAGNLILDRGFITAETANSQGGNIDLRIGEFLFFYNGSKITATAGTALGAGDGGNITIFAPWIIAFPNEMNYITANAFAGKGGNIFISTNGILVPRYLTITASSQFGLQGEVNIQTPGVDPTSGLVNLPENLVDADSLLGKDICAVKDEQIGGGSSFVIIGKGGLPAEAIDLISNSPGFVEWKTYADNLAYIHEDDQPLSVNNNDHLETSNQPLVIQQAQGWIINPDGTVILTAEAPIISPIFIQVVPPKCSLFSDRY